MSITKISPSVVDFDAGITITTDDNSNNLTLTSTDADANSGPNLDLYRNSSSPAASDVLGTIFFHGEDGAGNKEEYVRIQSVVDAKGSGAEVGVFQIFTNNAGTLTNNRFEIDGSGVTINESGGNFDFRVESDGDTHRLFVDAGNDRVLIGTTASRTMSGVTPDFFIEGTTYDDSSIGMAINANGANDCPAMFFGKSRGTSLGSNTIVQNGDRLFSMRIDGSDGTNLEQAALIEVHVDGVPGANEIPGRLTFWTTTDGSQYATEKMRIDNAGAAYFMTTDDMFGDVNVKGTTGVAIGTANDAGYYRRIYTNASSGASLYFWNGSNQGELNSAGAWVDASDIALKKDIVDIEYGLEVVKKLKPRKYKMKSDDSDQIGFVAQEVESEVPEVVSTSENPNGEEQKSLSYGHLTAVLTKAIQEQQTLIETLEAKVKALEEA